MTQKQTRCPNCQTVYKVSVTQLTISQGMVCCPKCSAEFNALVHLVKIEKDLKEVLEIIYPDTIFSGYKRMEREIKIFFILHGKYISEFQRSVFS